MIRAVRRGHRLGKVDVEPERRMAGDPRGAVSDMSSWQLSTCPGLWFQLVSSASP
ncbi:MAG: hypothetical protein CM1200mP2_49030 [Planctomycetaceae bacterium]|nr:MAG: hypothetical protein CM1200mP2_49030 [Planctomycetaceae bacterium]